MLKTTKGDNGLVDDYDRWGNDHDGGYDPGDCGHQDDYASGENIHIDDCDRRCHNHTGDHASGTASKSLATITGTKTTTKRVKM